MQHHYGDVFFSLLFASFPFSSKVIEGKLTPLDKVKQTILPAARAIEDAWDRKVKPAVNSVVSLSL